MEDARAAQAPNVSHSTDGHGSDISRERELLHALVDHIPVMLCIYDPAQRRFEVNAEFERVLGWTGAEAAGGDFMARVWPDPVLRAEAAAFMRSPAPGWREFPVTAKDGSAVPGEWANVALPDGRVIGIGIDVRPRRQAYDALRESEEKFRGAFANAAIGFAMTSPDGRFVDANAAYCALSGYSLDELRTLSFPTLIHPDDRAHNMRLIEAMLSGEMPGFVIDNRYLRKEGAVVWVRKSVSVIRGEDGAPRWIIALIENVTERRLAEAALRRSTAELTESEQHFRELADSVPDLVWIAGPDGSVSYFNRRWYEQTGLSPEESLGHGWMRVLHPEDRERCEAEWRHSMRSGAQYEAVCRFRTARGEYRRFLDRGIPSRDERGRVVRWVGTCTDIEESKRAEERLLQTQKLESVGLLAGGIAHDFNNLLTGILGNASLALEENPGSAGRIREVIAGARRAAHLTAQLLAYSGKGRFVTDDIDVSQAAQEMSDLVQFSIPKSVDLAINVQKRLPLVRMDPGQLQQILMNLVINAGEAVGEGNPGKVTVSTSMLDLEGRHIDAVGQEVTPGRYVCIEVSDTGGGIDDHTRARIFDPFFTTKCKGRGLGLAAVAGIVRSQKGAIMLESAPGRGSTFRVLLPTAEIRMRGLAEPAGAGARATVLVVDDEISVRDFIALVLRRQGCRVLVASDGRDALTVFDREADAIDAVVLDVVMPIMGANDLLPLIKARRPDVEVLLTSGYSEAEARRLCAAYPGAAFIQKPYAAQQIARAVEDLLAARAVCAPSSA